MQLYNFSNEFVKSIHDEIIKVKEEEDEKSKVLYSSFTQTIIELFITIFTPYSSSNDKFLYNAS